MENGQTIWYYRNGQTEIIKSYKDGQLNDQAIWYYEDGRTKIIKNYEN
jgi:antitoxin component YwqK of YwqJK toxin-antitoxin module